MRIARWTPRLTLGLPLMGLALAGSAPAHARKPDPIEACERIRPEQQLPTETREAVDALVQVGLTGLGRGQVDVEVQKEARFDTELLRGDALARAWFTYQLCVLRASGGLSPGLHEALLAEAWGLPPGERPAATLGVPVTAEAAVAGSGDMRFLPTPGVATLVLAACPPMTALGAPRSPGRLRWKVNGAELAAPTTRGLAVDVPPGRVSLEARYRYATVTAGAGQELQVEDGKVHYIAVDWSWKFGNVVGMALRPVDPVEGEVALARCTDTTRQAL